MPRMTDRERLAKIEADQRALAQEADTMRRSVRDRYGEIVRDIAVETMTEREFRDVLAHAARLGGAKAISVLKATPG